MSLPLLWFGKTDCKIPLQSLKDSGGVMTIIKYCPKCAQKPYTDKLTLSECPVCGAELVTEYVANEVLRKRPVLQAAVSAPSDTSLPGPTDSAEVIVKDTDAVYDRQDRTPAAPPVYQNPAETHNSVPVIPGGTYCANRIFQYRRYLHPGENRQLFQHRHGRWSVPPSGHHPYF